MLIKYYCTYNNKQLHAEIGAILTRHFTQISMRFSSISLESLDSPLEAWNQADRIVYLVLGWVAVAAGLHVEVEPPEQGLGLWDRLLTST